MEFLFTDPDVKLLPPAKTRLLAMHVDVYPDGKRMWVDLDVTPHIRKSALHPVKEAERAENGTYKLMAILSFPKLGEVVRRDLVF